MRWLPLCPLLHSSKPQRFPPSPCNCGLKRPSAAQETEAALFLLYFDQWWTEKQRAFPNRAQETLNCSNWLGQPLGGSGCLSVHMLNVTLAFSRWAVTHVRHRLDKKHWLVQLSQHLLLSPGGYKTFDVCTCGNMQVEGYAQTHSTGVTFTNYCCRRSHLIINLHHGAGYYQSTCRPRPHFQSCFKPINSSVFSCCLAYLLIISWYCNTMV